MSTVMAHDKNLITWFSYLVSMLFLSKSLRVPDVPKNVSTFEQGLTWVHVTFPNNFLIKNL